jgi:hypothetical protein
VARESRNLFYSKGTFSAQNNVENHSAPYDKAEEYHLFVHISIHNPKPDKEELLIESMHRFAKAMKTQPGLREVHTLRDQNSGRLVGLAIWDSQQSMLDARPVIAKAIEGDDLDEWEGEKPAIFLLEET